MRRVPAIVVLAGLAAAGCGGGTRITETAPALPVNLTAYVDDTRVSLSPDAVGAGPLSLIITNQGSAPQSLALLPAGTPAAQPLAETPTIAPRGTAQLNVDLGSGAYSLTAAVNPGSAGAAIQPATLYIGAPRPTASNVLLSP